ncbi:hypothetical protein C9374_013290 [Naegleria lovaniensis]|uniref:RRM domain-containing protein n=1 Tax=Naegleria lovaniensis TaxID=51637 RepID=A0AA88GVM0_NAELO|nr:uncharacterized protein C9374_013290 [Naegleria lovaniensis]KAG2391805.1 hypothetical protein C9374_013290 [Naegleria lovaniensis]
MTVSNTGTTTTTTTQSTSTVSQNPSQSETNLKGNSPPTELQQAEPPSVEYASSTTSSSSSDIGEGESSVEEYPEEEITEDSTNTVENSNDSTIQQQNTNVEREPPRLDLNTVKLFVGQIPYSYSEENLYPLFTQFGQVAEIVVIRDRFTQKSRGCAFVSFRDREGADLCIKELNQRFKLPPLNTPMRVKYAFTEQQYESFSSEFENTPSNDSSSNGTGSSGSSSGGGNEGVMAHSSTFLSTLNEKFDFGQPHPENKLFIRNIPKSVTEEELSRVFEPFGEIQDTVVLRTTIHTSKGCGFVKFVHAESAQQCVDAFRNEIIQPLQEKIWSQFKEHTYSSNTSTNATASSELHADSSQQHPQPRVLSQEQISIVDSIFKQSSFLIEGAITPLVVRYADDDTKLQQQQQNGNESYTNATRGGGAYSRKSSYSHPIPSSNYYYSQYYSGPRQRRHSTPSHYRFTNPYLQQYQRGVATGYYYAPQLPTSSSNSSSMGTTATNTAWGYGDPSTFYGYTPTTTGQSTSGKASGSGPSGGEEAIYYYTPASPAMYGHPASAGYGANGTPLLYSQVASNGSSNGSSVYHSTTPSSNNNNGGTEENGRTSGTSTQQQQPQQPFMYYYYYYPPTHNPYKYSTSAASTSNNYGSNGSGGDTQLYSYPVNRNAYPMYTSSSTGYSKKRQNQKSNRIDKGASPQNATNYKLFDENATNQKRQTSSSDA